MDKGIKADESYFHFFLFFWPGLKACGILVPDQEQNPHPLQQKHMVITTGPPAKSWKLLLIHNIWDIYVGAEVGVCVCLFAYAI